MTSPSIHPLPKRLWSIPTVRAVVWAVSVFILMEITLFSPNGYLRLAEPKSYVGQIMERRHALQVIKGMRAPVKCAVLGDSRMGEGFSAFEAEEASGSDVIWFNASVSGSTPRTWYQILRFFNLGDDFLVLQNILDFSSCGTLVLNSFYCILLGVIIAGMILEERFSLFDRLCRSSVAIRGAMLFTVVLILCFFCFPERLYRSCISSSDT